MTLAHSPSMRCARSVRDGTTGMLLFVFGHKDLLHPQGTTLTAHRNENLSELSVSSCLLSKGTCPNLYYVHVIILPAEAAAAAFVLEPECCLHALPPYESASLAMITVA